LHLGARHPGDSLAAEERLRELERLFRLAPFGVRIVENILPFKYSKLMYNAAISPLAAAAGLDNGQLLSVKIARGLFYALLEENYDILAAAGVALERIGLFHPSTVKRIVRRRWLANFAAIFFYPSLRGSYCSMSGDLPKGRTEIDYYNRHLIDLAERHSQPSSLNQRVYALVKEMECERATPGLDWLQRLASRAA
jgi:2-dehydropantoate 2-reductase